MALKIPLGLDERTVEQFAEREPVTGAIVADAEMISLGNAVKAAREAAVNIVALSDAAHADKTQTQEAAIVRVASAAVTTAQRVAPRFDAVRAKTQETIANIDKRTMCPPPPSNQVDLALEQEVRTRLLAMPEKQRDEVIRKAFAAKDLAVIGAVLRVPPFLVGIGEAKHALLRHNYQQAFHGQDVARKKRLAKALEVTENAGLLFFQFMRQLTESESARMLAENRARAEEAFAQHLQGE